MLCYSEKKHGIIKYSHQWVAGAKKSTANFNNNQTRQLHCWANRLLINHMKLLTQHTSLYESIYLFLEQKWRVKKFMGKYWTTFFEYPNFSHFIFFFQPSAITLNCPPIFCCGREKKITNKTRQSWYQEREMHNHTCELRGHSSKRELGKGQRS